MMKFCLEGGKACFWTVFFLEHCCIVAFLLHLMSAAFLFPSLI